MFTFAFENNIAMIKDGDTPVIIQPFKPVVAGQVAWASEEEALEWMQDQHPSFFDQEGLSLPEIEEPPIQNESQESE